MLAANLLNNEILICSTVEARKVWKDQPEDRPKIWLEEEACAALLLRPEEIQSIITHKQTIPGWVYKG